MLRKHLDTILLITGFVLVVVNLGFLILVTGPENVRSVIQLTPGLFGFVLVLISMALSEMKSGKKTVKEAIASIVVQMFLLGVFILVSLLFGH